MIFKKINRHTWTTGKSEHGYYITIKQRRPKSRDTTRYYWRISKNWYANLEAYKGYEWELSLAKAKETAMGAILEEVMFKSIQNTG